MSISQRLLPFFLFIISALAGCSGLNPSRATSTAPVFLPTAEDAPRVATLRHELDTKSVRCLEAANCEQVYFGRALVGLFENRETASANFRRVIDHNPVSPLASISQLWLRMIGDQEAGAVSGGESNPTTGLLAQFVREWMDLHLNERAAFAKPAKPAITAQEQPVGQQRDIHGMQKQLRERDQLIAALRAQLEALRVIDEDHQDKYRKVKPPASLKTSDHYPGH